MADGAKPCLTFRPTHGDSDAEIGVAGLQFGELLSKNEIPRRTEAEDQVDLTWPTGLGEIARRAHHGRDTHATADQDHAFRLFPAEEESPIRRLGLNLVADPQLIMQPARNQAMFLAFDRDLDPIAPSGCGCDSVGALGRYALWRDMERQELTGQVIEGK